MFDGSKRMKNFLLLITFFCFIQSLLGEDPSNVKSAGLKGPLPIPQARTFLSKFSSAALNQIRLSKNNPHHIGISNNNDKGNTRKLFSLNDQEEPTQDPIIVVQPTLRHSLIHSNSKSHSNINNNIHNNDNNNKINENLSNGIPHSVNGAIHNVHESRDTQVHYPVHTHKDNNDNILAPSFENRLNKNVPHSNNNDKLAHIDKSLLKHNRDLKINRLNKILKEKFNSHIESSLEVPKSGNSQSQAQVPPPHASPAAAAAPAPAVQAQAQGKTQASAPGAVAPAAAAPVAGGPANPSVAAAPAGPAPANPAGPVPSVGADGSTTIRTTTSTGGTVVSKSNGGVTITVKNEVPDPVQIFMHSPLFYLAIAAVVLLVLGIILYCLREQVVKCLDVCGAACFYSFKFAILPLRFLRWCGQKTFYPLKQLIVHCYARCYYYYYPASIKV